ncbi:MAG: hypothetical protein HOG49_18290 [Candidatus Scalindua sp.]|jgi:hypothetical protein|nr:hypothetical protein [Candidatus Scalindua sp.]
MGKFPYTNLSHGHSKKGEVSSTYNSWRSMKRRCNCLTGKNWRNYGSRGITYCARWDKFANFLADMGEKPEGFSLERENNDGDYEPNNCSWISLAQQANNKRTNGYITHNNIRKTVAEWSRVLGINVRTLRSRINKGWAIDKAFTI